MKFDRLGWIVAAALLGGVVGMGFQDKAEKFGTVDMGRVFNESEFAKKQTDSLRTMGATRQGVMDFLRANPHIKPEDATKFRDLSLKDAPSAPEKADLERVKNDAKANETKFNGLVQKANPTQADVTALEELNRNKDSVQGMLEKWGQDFMGEVSSRQETLRNETLQRVKDAVQTVAKTQGYSVLFSQEAAPYAANDLTNEALKAMNAKK